MHTKKHILWYIDQHQGKAKTQKEVEKIHQYFEAYIKHLALTTLRLHGAKYKEGRKYINGAWIPCTPKMLQLILLKLFNQSNNQQNWKKILVQQPTLKAALDLLFNYTVPIRNQLVHGGYYPFGEGEENLIFDIYLLALAQLEQLVANRKKGKTILQHTPTDFGASSGKKETIGQLKSILNFAAANKGYKFEKAKALYDALT